MSSIWTITFEQSFKHGGLSRRALIAIDQVDDTYMSRFPGCQPEYQQVEHTNMREAKKRLRQAGYHFDGLPANSFSASPVIEYWRNCE